MGGEELGRRQGTPATVHPQDFGIGRLFRCIREAVIVADVDIGRIVLWNPAAEALFGYSEAEALGLSVDALVPEYLRDRHRAGLARYRATGRGPVVDAATALELPARRKTGKECIVELTLSPVADAAVPGRFVLALIRDVTERKQKEEARAALIREQAARAEAEAAERRFRALVQNAADIILVLDAGGRVGYAGPSVTRVLGYQAEEHIGANVFAFVHPEDRPRVQQSFAGAVAQPGVHQWIEFRIRHADGSWRYVEAASNVLFHEPSVRGTVVNIRDVTERRQAEENHRFLAEASAVLASSLDYETTLASVARLAVPVLADWCAVDIADEEGAIRRLAVAAQDRAKEELVWKLRELYPYNAEGPGGVPQVARTGEPELVPAVTDEQLAAAAVDAEHLRILRELGMRSYLRVPLVARGRTFGVISLIAAESGRRYGPADLALAADLAGRAAIAVDNARLYREARAALAEAEAALAVRDEFLSVASHELRTPLTALKGQIHLARRRLARGVAAREVDELMARADTQVDRLNRLVHELLDVSRIASGQFAVEHEPVPVAPLVRHVVELECAVEEPPREIDLSLPETAPVVAADAGRLEQVLVNLLENARTYSPPGRPVHVRVGVADGRMAIAVQDEGIGIPPEELPHIFDRFHRAGNVDKGIAGLGLGLYIVHEIVRALGGTLTVESTPRVGSTFTVTLPLLDEDGDDGGTSERGG